MNDMSSAAIIRRVADPLIEQGATPEQVQLEVLLQTGFGIGGGGKGGEGGSPECPYCGATGNGGHGGLCPRGT